MSILQTIFFFIVAIGILVTFHEFGHYWVARKAGVRVLRFSVGFGKPLYTWRRQVDGETIEYVIAAIPLGGYVKMLDQREGNVAEEDLPKAFNTQPLSSRVAIVAAGPIFNFLLAIFFYWLIFVYGSVAERPLLGEPEAGTPVAISGFLAEDEVIGVNGDEVRTWADFRLAIIEHGLDGGELPVSVIDVSGTEQQRILQLGEKGLLKEEGDVVGMLGFRQWWPDLPPQIGGVTEDGAAKAAGLEGGDKVLALNGETVTQWSQIVDTVKDNPAKPVAFDIDRQGERMTVTVIPEQKTIDDQAIGFIGAYQVVPEEVKDRLLIDVQYGVFESAGKAVVKTWDMSVLTLRVLGRMVTGDASIKNISGPITIAKYAGVTAQIGFTTYIAFLAVISLSLGVLNLLPVPMLDGGHLLYYLIEFIKGSPVSEAVELRGQQIGMVVLAMLMTVALFNDFQRLLQ